MSWTTDEMMSVAAARALPDGASCFVGIGLPSTAANLARRIHAPELVLIYEAGAIVLPTWSVTAVAEAPRGAHPSYAHGYYDRDNGFYQQWDPISRERDSFREWMDEHVMARQEAA